MGMDDTRVRIGAVLYRDLSTFVGTGTNTLLIAAPGAGKKLLITRLIFYPKAGTTGTLNLIEGASTRIFPSLDQTKSGVDDLHLLLSENTELRGTWTFASGIEFYISYQTVPTTYIHNA